MSRRSADAKPGESSLPVDSSWRMVEGEHDSFDTTILPPLGSQDDFGYDVFVPLSSGQPSLSAGLPSQLSHLSSQGNNACGASQDSIRDFAKHQDDDHVILREPFRPRMSMTPSYARAQSSAHRTPDPQFRMPLVDTSSGASSRTAAPFAFGARHDAQNGEAVRRRGKASMESPARKQRRRTMSASVADDVFDAARRKPAHARDANVVSALFSTLYKLGAWAGDVVFIAMTYAKYPLGAVLAVYLVFGSLIMAQNMATRSIYAAVSPLCRVPGASLLGLPFCPPGGGATSNESAHPVEFDDLVGIQSQLEQVLWSLWTLVGANSASLRGLARQLALLRQVDAQHSSARAQVGVLVFELETMQAGLGDLRDRVAEPGLLATSSSSAAARVARIPLAVHIETIDRGVERLLAARSRLRAAEDERVRDSLARGAAGPRGGGGEGLIDSKP